MPKRGFGCFHDVHETSYDVCVCAPTNPVLEGAELIDTICPVNKFTGHRDSPFKLLGKLTGAKADLLNAVLSEIPTIKSDPRLSDDDRAQYVVERLSTGSPAEDALMAERIMNDLEALGLKDRSAAVDPSKDTIEFKEGDQPSVES